MKKILKKIIKILCLIILIPVVLFMLMIVWLTIREYKPAENEKIEVSNANEICVKTGEEIRMVTWNMGCGTLGDNADFFMDYGKMVYSADKNRVGENLSGITMILKEIDADIINLQEIDTDSSRSYHMDETSVLRELYPDFDNTFAYNYKVDYVPYPLPPIGKVESGIMTLSRFDILGAERIQLPCPFRWPVRVANLKRCITINRLPVEGTDKELVIINLHLEAFDDGEGKIAQTKMLADILESELQNGNYIIAAGDFNQSFSGTDISKYPEYEGKWHAGLLNEDDFNEAFTFCQDPESPTCRALDQPYITAADKEHFQFYVIDGFIVSEGIEILSVETYDHQFKWTDHNPVIMDFRITG